MVDFKTKTYVNEDNQLVGAEVTVFSKTGENIGNIVITNSEDLEDIEDRLTGLEDSVVSKETLSTELTKLDVNAATLDGHGSDYFAQVAHTHHDLAPIPHDAESNVYGLGTGSRYGHVKTVNNLTTAIADNGEALAAYQGKVLSDKINTSVKNNSVWTKVIDKSYIEIWYNASLKMCYAYVSYSDYKGFAGGATDKTIYSKGTIPNSYRPPGAMRKPVYRGDVVVSLMNDGSLVFWSISKISSLNISTSFLYPVDSTVN